MERPTGAVNEQQISYSLITGLTLTAALGGFLFGYDTAVIAGVEMDLVNYFSLNTFEHGFAVSCALLGCILGAASAGFLSYSFGRKNTLIVAAILYTASAIGSALPETFPVFVFFRMLGGIGVGVASMVSPMYIAEIAPSNIRGRLISYQQLAIVAGIFIVFFVNYLIDGLGDDQWNLTAGWRWKLGSEALPAFLFFVLLFFIPESPRWHVIRHRPGKAGDILGRLFGAVNSGKLLKEIEESVEAERRLSAGGSVFNPLMIKITLIGVGLSVLQQVVGINAILYYAPRIFQTLGSGQDTALLQAVILGAVNLLLTIVAIFTVDRLGRKPLIYIGCAGMFICLATVGAGVYMDNLGAWLVVFILGYIASFAVSLGPVVWVLLAEMFPNRMRSAGMAIAVAAQWTFNFLVSQTFPAIKDVMNGAFPFWFYAAMCLVTIIFTWMLVPETKGKTLEEMENMWEGRYKN